MPGESQKHTLCVRKCVWMCLVCPGVREELTIFCPNMLFITLLFPILGSPTRHTVSASLPLLHTLPPLESLKNHSSALQTSFPARLTLHRLIASSKRGTLGWPTLPLVLRGAVKGTTRTPPHPFKVSDPGADGLKGHEVALVEDDDGVPPHVRGDVAPEGVGEVEEGAPCVEDDEGNVASLESSPYLAPHLDVVLEEVQTLPRMLPVY
eukprot:CAMPEP_0169436162 /NCGR_PEP_ID=MMETSP1042-20121227/5445_1 /TAXON_ID=464988 /ORGANISM="Hemiselmis andersenii, Strain CCMP1180" /LENGTH=207 /DNA_ID=CAMNT_0009546845 /DNA_START=346 /DNA_END=966 /DNA_ORIENTATION=+